MKVMRINTYVENILTLVYEYRAVTLEQLSRKLNRTMPSIYTKVNLLQKAGLLETESVTRVKGYGEVHAQGKYVYITDKGITALKEIEYDFKEPPKRAIRNKPTRNQLPFIILANEIYFELNRDQWRVYDSRMAKKYLNRQRNELLDGMLQSKETNELYGMYITLPIQTKEKIPSELYTGMLFSELKKHAGQMNSDSTEETLNQYIFFCKDIEWYRHLIQSIPQITNGNFLSKVKSLRVLPFETGKYLLKTLAKEDVQHRFSTDLVELAFPNLSFKTSFELTKREMQLGFDFKVELNGKVFFGVNLIDMDLKKVHRLKRYTEVEYDRYEKTEVILFAMDFNSELLKEQLTYSYMRIETVFLYNIIEKLGLYE